MREKTTKIDVFAWSVHLEGEQADNFGPMVKEERVVLVGKEYSCLKW